MLGVVTFWIFRFLYLVRKEMFCWGRSRETTKGGWTCRTTQRLGLLDSVLKWVPLQLYIVPGYVRESIARVLFFL